MAAIFELHPVNPQPRTIVQIVEALKAGAVMLYPTDTVYAIGCDMNHKGAVQRVRQLKQLSNDKPVTFLCSSLSNIAQYAYVSDAAYRLMRRLIPGPYTFLLPATKLVPRLVQNPKRKTTGIRVPDHDVSQALLTALGNPIISTSARLPDNEAYYVSTADLFDAFDKRVDLIIDTGEPPGQHMSTILDLTVDPPLVVRKGQGWEALPAELVTVD
ncbi:MULTISPECIES: L-threonylcarbamoyladenylate synthase [unclassified Thermosynechococcus]|uniref:L-threonylcarbamoyladenylate synthase n=1 Tax=unclassified Thermosynechococcus TaxID=2622553 RepID=UPI0019EB6E29|nr:MULTISPECIES: L-threonylcarbamoyladenylate synthase [unclassified Thermosynechococcus]HIK34189.1 threonylcarbamoyl-AMP synthase [Thermosynechococcus sp. M98_K2018_005]HIK48100.1 threonylcarbamoyl-AMP synthase [Thermosynechococcus sp. M55_K2018_012]